MNNIVVGTLMILGPFFIPIALLCLFYKLNIPKNISILQVFGIMIIGGFGSAWIAMHLNKWFFIEGTIIARI